ncbi:prominin-1-like [Patiria miniata]|uniref:Prominin-1-A-like n=1 Tax=Patiria miniata TaxID=46514 RepID=A0A914B5F7_PATMI|nr:prominin-1-like [Patiria miniata]
MPMLPVGTHFLALLLACTVAIPSSTDAGHGDASSAGASVGRSAGGLVSRWVLFEGELGENLGWLLGSYADLAREFVYKITPTGFPWDPLIGIFTGSSDIIQALLEIVKSEGGILAVSLVLLLLGLLLPISGVFFCLCRCCGHCGAARREERIRELVCNTGVVMGAFLLVFSLLVVVASCFTILSGERLSQSVMHFEGNVNAIMDDVDNFQDDLIRGVGNVSDIIDNTMATLEDAENAIFGPVASQFGSISGPLNSTVSQLNNDLAAPLISLSAISGSLGGTIAQLKTDGSAFQTAVNDVASSLQTFLTVDCSGSLPDTVAGVCAFIPGHSPFAGSLSFSVLNDYDVLPVVVYTAVPGPALTAITDLISTGDTALNDAKSAVGNASQDVFQDVGDTLATIETTVTTVTDEVVSGLEESLGESLDTQAFRDQIGGYVDLVEDYDMYSYVAFMVFASLGFVMSLLCLLGLLFGACGYDSSRRPSQRSNTSECGGQFMVGSTWWTFVFAILFCLPTAVWFIIGANVTLICDSMEDLTIMDKLVDNPVLWNGNTLLDSLVQFGDSPLNLTARHFIEDCQENQTLYEAFHLSSAGLLDAVDGVNIDEFMPYVDTFRYNMTSTITGFDLLAGPTDLTLLVSALSVPAFPLISMVHSVGTLRGLTEAVPAQSAINDLNLFINKTWEAYDAHGASQPDFQQQVDYATDIITELQSLENMQSNLLALMITYANQVTFFEATFYEVKNLTIDALPSIASDSQDLLDLSLDAGDIVETSLNSTIDGLIANAEELVTGPINKIENEVGRCGVVAGAYEAIVAEVCVHFLTGFNALWLSTGIISLCCLPIIVLTVRLSKYVRRAKPTEGSRYSDMPPTADA